MNAFVYFFLFMFFVSGFMFVSRILLQQRRERVLSTQVLAKIGTTHFMLMVALIFFVPVHVSVMAILSFCFVTFSVSPMVARFREQHFKDVVISFTNDVLLGMKTGSSFRHAFECAKQRCDAFTQQKLTDIMAHVAFSQQTTVVAVSPFARLVIEEFMQVDQKPHRAIQRLELFRARLKMEQNFRRRSGESTRQIRMQAVLLSFVYAGVLVLVSTQVRLIDHLTVIEVSALMMLAGYFGMWRVAKGFQWKV